METMKRKLIITILLLTYFSPTICHAGVNGTLNKKFVNNFPRKLIVVIIESTKQDDDIMRAFRKVIDEHWFTFIEDNDVSNETKKNYNPFFADNLSHQVIEGLKNKTAIDGVLLIDINNPFRWIFPPLTWTQTARVIIYDAQSGEWAYKFDAVCGFAIFYATTCSIAADDMYRYFRSNFNHKIKQVKFRQ